MPSLISQDEWATLPRTEHIIEDTIEGWAEALRHLVNARMGLYATRPTFVYTSIRAKGAPLSVGGKAPGPEPLRVCLDKVEALLSSRDGRLTSVDCFDLVMYASDAVLSGGVRRAASIALFSPDDEGMISAKTGTWWQDNPQRARANISAVITDDTEKSVYEAIFSATKQYGEPGFIFSKSKEFLYNPCVEIGMAPVLITDECGDVVSEYTVDMLEDREYYEGIGYEYVSGWQACNLVEVNCALFKSKEDAFDAVQQATILATAQAGYTHSDYLPSVSRHILERESLIGVSLTGMANCPEIAFDPTWQREAAKLVRKTNKRFASELGINAATRTTCVKPSGNAAVLLGCTSGIHAEYARRYIRNVQVSAQNPVGQFFKEHMPAAVSKSVWSAPGTEDLVISFPVDATGNDTLYRKDLTAESFIDMITLTQTNWIECGTHLDRGVEGLRHNVSNTILVQEGEWEGVCEKLWQEREHLTGVSLLSMFGDYVYEQPPFQEIVENIDENDPLADKKRAAAKQWQELRDAWVSPDYTLLKEGSDTTQLLQEASCVGGACEFTPQR